MDAWYSLPGFFQPMSSFSHLAGAVVFAVLGGFLLRRSWHDRTRFWFVMPFVLCTVGTLAVSAVFHMFVPGGDARAVMLRLDVSAIFALIASTFTAIHGVLFYGIKRWGVVALVWGLTILGITVRCVFFDQIPRSVGLGVFLGQGWLGALTVTWLLRWMPWREVKPVVVGGVCYTLGAISNGLGWPTVIPYVWGPHETFHLAVLAGLGCHWRFVFQIVSPEKSRTTIGGRGSSALENQTSRVSGAE